MDHWNYSREFILNGPIIMFGWPIAYGTYFPIAYRDGGSIRLWDDASILLALMVVFFLCQPIIYIWYSGPLAAAGFCTFTLPLSVLFSAYIAEFMGIKRIMLLFQVSCSCLVAIVVSVSFAWIA